MRTALVLGGGGVTGVSWEVGVLHALAERDDEVGAAVRQSDLVVGTSAGSVVGTHVAAGTDLARLFAAQSEPAPEEIAPDVDLADVAIEIGLSTEGARDPSEARRQIGRVAAARGAGHAAARRAAVAARLPGPAWPPGSLRVTAVDVESGEDVAFSADDGVDLVDAVTASCAVPGVWPVVPAGGRRLMDGGVASITHCSLAQGHDLVLVVAAIEPSSGLATRGLEDEVAGLRAAGSRVVVVGPDPDYLAGPGASPLDPAGRSAAAIAGDRFGRLVDAAA